ncbi:UbiA family prenyltransferase [Streptomyces racemochromogenes]|uniref:UbiA family prenyltransferase n=1 Tax=Streptomyces racemochromogenes TaxID=67353 RepID=A0ABW7PFA3_9ACTN
MINLSGQLIVTRPARSLDIRWHSLAETARLCWQEARPVVQVAFLLRFAVGAVCAAQPPQSPGRPVLGLASLWCAVVCAYLLNGVTDVQEDRVNGSWRPIARGDLPERTAARATVLLACAALLLGGLAGPGVVAWTAAFLGLGWAYSAEPVKAKCSSGRCALVVCGLGLTAYGAGVAASGGGWTATGALVAGVMSAWMALVGAVAKDLGDVSGDAAGGRRTVAVVRGPAAARALAVAGALAVGTAAPTLALLWAEPALAAAVPVALGAVWVVVRVLRGARREHAGRAERRGAYRAFMVTQYAANLAVLTVPFVLRATG